MFSINNMPVLQPIPVTKRGERRRWLLKEDWVCDVLGPAFTFIIPAGFIFDGASIPRLFWNMLSPTGYLFLAGLMHDFIYKFRFLYLYSTMESLDGDARRIIKIWFNQKDADEKFETLADNICVGSRIFTKAAYISLRAFGWKAWNEHRKKQHLCLLEPKGFISIRKARAS